MLMTTKSAGSCKMSCPSPVQATVAEKEAEVLNSCSLVVVVNIEVLTQAHNLTTIRTKECTASMMIDAMVFWLQLNPEEEK